MWSGVRDGGSGVEGTAGCWWVGGWCFGGHSKDLGFDSRSNRKEDTRACFEEDENPLKKKKKGWESICNCDRTRLSICLHRVMAGYGAQ